MISIFFALKALFQLAKKHAQYYGLYIAAEDFIVLDLEDSATNNVATVEEQELDGVVRHAVMGS